MSALLLKSDTNVREFLMGTLWKLWVKAEWMNTEIYTHHPTSDPFQKTQATASKWPETFQADTGDN